MLAMYIKNGFFYVVLILVSFFILSCELASYFTNKFLKQPSRDVHRKRFSENMQRIYRRTPMPMCDFDKVAWQSCVVKLRCF